MGRDGRGYAGGPVHGAAGDPRPLDVRPPAQVAQKWVVAHHAVRRVLAGLNRPDAGD